MTKKPGHAFRFSAEYPSSIEGLKELNSSFDIGVMRIAYHGRNRNNMYISKDAFNDALRTIYNCPIVCNYDRNSDTIGSHDVEIVRHNDGSVQMVNITTPVGMVPESAKQWWTEVTEDDGTVHEYLCTDILLWKRQEAYSHIKKNGIIDESMEIKVNSGYRQDDGYYYVASFDFLAFCLLESDPPCFESAGIELFASADFKQRCEQMLSDFKAEFSGVITASADDIKQTLLKGGRDDLIANYETMDAEANSEVSSAEIEVTGNEPIVVEDATMVSGIPSAEFDTTEAPVEDAVSENETVIHDDAGENNEQNEGIAGDETAEEPGAGQTFSLTACQMQAEIADALSTVMYNDPIWGECHRYLYIDHSMDPAEVYAWDIVDGFIYGMAFSMNGDHVLIDFETRKRKKTVFVDFDEGDAEVSIREIIKRMGENFAKRFAAENTVFEQFPDLVGNEAFEALRSNCADMTIEEIEEKCFALRGRYGTKFSYNDKPYEAQVLPIERCDTGYASHTDEPYGGLFVKFNIGKR